MNSCYGSRRDIPSERSPLRTLREITAQHDVRHRAERPRKVLTCYENCCPSSCQTDVFPRTLDQDSQKARCQPLYRTSPIASRWYEFLLPPLAEQRRIAETLQAMEQVSAKLLTLLTSLRVTQSAMFQSQINIHNTAATPLGNLLRLLSTKWLFRSRDIRFYWALGLGA